jgi:hypothetical protein
MKRWWCMDCRNPVELNRHGRCECCESEAVDLIDSENEITCSVSNIQEEIMKTQVSA